MFGKINKDKEEIAVEIARKYAISEEFLCGIIQVILLALVSIRDNLTLETRSDELIINEIMLL